MRRDCFRNHPTYLPSTDGGKSWGQSQELGDVPARIFAALCVDDAILVLNRHREEQLHFRSRRGREIGGWQQDDDGLWTTQIADVASGDWYFEQLWVDGRRATRAREANRFFHYMTKEARAS